VGFTAEAAEPRFLVIAQTDHAPLSVRPAPPAELGAELRDRLIVYGTLAAPESGEMTGVACALHAPGKDAAMALLRDRAARLDALPIVAVHD
jgi:hypothetical protein